MQKRQTCYVEYAKVHPYGSTLTNTLLFGDLELVAYHISVNVQKNPNSGMKNTIMWYPDVLSYAPLNCHDPKSTNCHWSRKGSLWFKSMHFMCHIALLSAETFRIYKINLKMTFSIRNIAVKIRNCTNSSKYHNETINIQI